MRCVLFLAFTGSLFAQSAYLLRGGTVHTISGPVLQNGSILIRDGKIVGVGKDLAAPEGVTVIDLAGQHVYPGMIDSGAMIAADDTRENTFVNPQLRVLSAIDPDSQHLEATRANGVTGIVAMPDGDLISGQMAIIHLDGGNNEEMAILPSAAIHLRFPAIVTVPRASHEPSDDEEPKTAVEEERIPFEEAQSRYLVEMDELNTFFKDARRYWRAKLTGMKNLAPNRKFDAIIPVLEGKTPLFVTAVREREIREAIAFADREKVRIILADPYEAYKLLDLIKARNIPVVLGPTNTLPLNRDDDYDRSFTTPGELFKAGIKFSIATFSNTRSRNLPYEAAAAVAYGLPHDEAFKAITLNAAEIFGISKRYGSIEEGKVADLIVTDGDPMEAFTAVKRVFIDGKPVDLETRQKKLYEKYLGRK